MALPKNCVAMQEDEMMYTEGGLSLNVSLLMLNKTYCSALGAQYAGTAGLSASRIAAEIYAHAFLYYVGAPIAFIAGSIGSSTSATQIAVNYIVTHSNPIDIGGDNATRVAVYNFIWAVF
jgi:hypothetical protein